MLNISFRLVTEFGKKTQMVEVLSDGVVVGAFEAAPEQNGVRVLTSWEMENPDKVAKHFMSFPPPKPK